MNKKIKKKESKINTQNQQIEIIQYTVEYNCIYNCNEILSRHGAVEQIRSLNIIQ